MRHIERHKPGNFCWAELGTTHQVEAKKFYTQLFGWGVRDLPMGPNDFYTMFKLEGRDVGAAYTLRPDMLAQGVPPHWMVYVAVESADVSAARAASLGGKVLAPAFDVFDVGRMAVLEDPTGAHISLWQPKRPSGFGISGTGTFCWADLSTGDRAPAQQFYSGLFGWQFMKSEKDDYLHIQNGEEFIGGIPPAAHRDPSIPPHWALYFAVADCDASAATAKRLGAGFYLPPTTFEGVGRMAVIRDPQGAAFSIFQAMPQK
jgi:predicted enzyme related to lactoylglutathione lyase